MKVQKPDSGAGRPKPASRQTQPRTAPQRPHQDYRNPNHGEVSSKRRTKKIKPLKQQDLHLTTPCIPPNESQSPLAPNQPFQSSRRKSEHRSQFDNEAIQRFNSHQVSFEISQEGFLFKVHHQFTNGAPTSPQHLSIYDKTNHFLG